MPRMTWNIWKLLRRLNRQSSRVRAHRTVNPATGFLEVLEARALPTGNASAEIAGIAFLDANRNSSRSANETLIPGIPVQLTGQTTQGVVVNSSVTTDANGAYRLTNVLPGNYTISAGPGASFTGNGVSLSAFSVTEDQTLTRDFAFVDGIRPQLVSLRNFLNTSTIADIPFAAAGTGTAPVNDRENNLPELSNGPTTFDVGKNQAAATFDLANVFTDPDMSNSQVRFETSVGNINVELFDTDAPQTVANFFNYVDDDPRTATDAGRYDGSIFNRLARDFVLQGGNRSFVTNNGIGSFVDILKDPAIENEFGASNTRGTIAMARIGGMVNSASSEFFFNIANNTGLNNVDGGFTVFGRILDAAGLAVLDSINAVQDILPQLGPQDGIPRVGYTGTNFPADATSANFITINDVEIVRRDEFLTYSLIDNTNESLVTASIVNNRLTLTHTPGTTGNAVLTIRATDKLGATFQTTFPVSIENQIPVASVSPIPAAPVATATLMATATKSDADGDPVTLTYEWSVNGVVVQTTSSMNNLTDTLNLTSQAVFDALTRSPRSGDIVRVSVTPNDNQDNGLVVSATTVINRVPVISSVQFSSIAPTTNAMLTATVAATDADNDPIGLSYEWSVNGVPVQTSSSNTFDLSVAGQGDLSDQITLVVTPSDGKESGSPVSAPAVVAASLPVVESFTLTPDMPATTDNMLTAAATPSDADGLPVTLTYEWMLRGSIVRTMSGVNLTSDSLDTSTLMLTVNDEISVKVTPKVTPPTGGDVTGNPLTITRTILS